MNGAATDFAFDILRGMGSKFVGSCPVMAMIAYWSHCIFSSPKKELNIADFQLWTGHYNYQPLGIIIFLLMSNFGEALTNLFTFMYLEIKMSGLGLDQVNSEANLLRTIDSTETSTSSQKGKLTATG